MEKIDIPKKELEKLYIHKKLSTYSITHMYNCNPSVIQKRLKEHKIKIRYPKKKIPLTKSELEELYIKQGLSTYKIAKIYNCGSRTVYGILKRHKIKPRPVRRVHISKEELFDLYTNKKLSFSKIADKFSCSPSIISDKMKSYGITARDLSEATTKYPKKEFSGNLIEKAYLIGFRLGDLNVFKDHNLITIKSNTTKLEQVELIRTLFGRYGKLQVKEYEKGIFNIQESLNRSFSFLLPKEDSVKMWILKNKRYFLSFLAGYIDAEGNIGIYSGRARVRIGSYDKHILKAIHKKLLTFEVNNKYHLETIAGKNNQNGDFWRVFINQKESILNLFKLIKPYLKHEKRCKDLKKAEENIILRSRRINNE